MEKNSNLTIPNILSVFRILLIPVFIITYFYIDNIDGYRVIPAVILGVSALTDVVDGMIARHYNQITQLGKIIDPLADKLSQFAMCVCLAVENWQLIFFSLILFGKELCFLIGGILISKKSINIPGAKWYGKVTTAVIFISLFLITLLPKIPLLINTLTIISILLLIISFVLYMMEYMKLTGETNQYDM